MTIFMGAAAQSRIVSCAYPLDAPLSEYTDAGIERMNMEPNLQGGSGVIAGGPDESEWGAWKEGHASGAAVLFDFVGNQAAFEVHFGQLPTLTVGTRFRMTFLVEPTLSSAQPMTGFGLSFDRIGHDGWGWQIFSMGTSFHVSEVVSVLGVYFSHDGSSAPGALGFVINGRDAGRVAAYRAAAGALRISVSYDDLVSADIGQNFDCRIVTGMREMVYGFPIGYRSLCGGPVRRL